MISANTQKWFFVYDQHGDPLAAFPNRELAEAYRPDNSGWLIREQMVTF